MSRPLLQISLPPVYEEPRQPGSLVGVLSLRLSGGSGRAVSNADVEALKAAQRRAALALAGWGVIACTEGGAIARGAGGFSIERYTQFALRFGAASPLSTRAERFWAVEWLRRSLLDVFLSRVGGRFDLALEAEEGLAPAKVAA
jgi:hypothetical protein